MHMYVTYSGRTKDNVKDEKKKKDDKLGHCLLDIIKYCRPI